MFERQIVTQLKSVGASFPVIVLTGPRQSGKTTLLKHLYQDYVYYSLESPDQLLAIRSDPRGFLERHKQGLIIDEAQHYPELFSYLQEIVDNDPKACNIIISGSQNFLLAEKISQTLAGRAMVFELLPLSYSEYTSNKNINVTSDLWQYLFDGSYPRPYNENIPTDAWYESYIRTYLERDVRTLINVKDLSQFQLFLKFCASFHGQEFNASVIATQLGISQTTVMSWLSILEASYIIFRLKPYYKNHKKRLSKRSKLYFYDSAIVCRLLGISSPEQLHLNNYAGAIFEGFIVSEVIKYYFALGKQPSIYFWREHGGHEVDLLIEQGGALQAIEIKATATLATSFTKHLKHLCSVITDLEVKPLIIYAGDKPTQLSNVNVISWQAVDKNLDGI